MKILITGNLGYIGPVLTQHLKQVNPANHLIGYDSGFFATCLMQPHLLPEAKTVDVQYFRDVRKLDETVLQDVDAIVYLSAISNDPMGKAFEAVTEQINAQHCIHLAQKGKQAGVRNFVFASSCSMYGAAEGIAKTENDTLNPLTAYAKSKVKAEQELERLADDRFTITSLRFATACGFSPRLRLDLVLNDFVANALVNKTILILSDGTPWRPLIHVKDMSRAIAWAISRKSDQGGHFLAVNTGSNQWNYQVKDLAHEVARLIEGVQVQINQDAQPDKRSYQVNFDLFEQLAPDHQPQVSLPAAIQELHEGLTQCQFNIADFRNSPFIRLNQLTGLKQAGLLSEELYWQN